MSARDEHPLEPVEPDAALARALAHLERPSARPEFRAAVRARFLAAEPGVGAQGGGPGASAEHGAPGQGAPTSVPDASPARRNLVFLAGALAAAAAIVLTLFLARSRAPVWTVHPSTTASVVRIDGVVLSIADSARVATALLAARELEVDSGTLRLGVRGEAWLELGPGTRLSQMKFAPAGPYQLRTDRGSLAVATLAPFGRRGLRVLTDDFEVQVTGTVFGVDVDETGSCVCTLEGTVRCDPAGAEPARSVEAGSMCFAWRDRRAALWGVAHAEHLAPLRALRR
ncbi:MAG: hypothetical protein JNK02_17250 [Planctomycetes bacterium]|nr:hypothetical protein [Planctomycetota bacterium]